MEKIANIQWKHCTRLQMWTSKMKDFIKHELTKMMKVMALFGIYSLENY